MEKNIFLEKKKKHPLKSCLIHRNDAQRDYEGEVSVCQEVWEVPFGLRTVQVSQNKVFWR